MPPKVTSEILDRLPPQNLDAEKNVLGCVMLDPDCLDLISSILKPDDFYADAHQTLYRSLLAMHDQNLKVDALLLLDYLARNSTLEIVGGQGYIAEVAQSVYTAANVRYYAGIVRRCSKLRNIIHANTECLRDAYEGINDPDEILASFEKSLSEIQTSSHGQEIVTARDAAIAVMDRIDAIMERCDHVGIMTGIQEFDMTIGGLFAGELIILAARPKVGKTALACQIAEHNAAAGKLVYYASLEMSSTELAQRTICGMAAVNSRGIRTGKLNDEERKKIVESTSSYANFTLRLDSRPALSVYDIRRSARRLLKEGLRLIVVDYLGLIQPRDKRIVREQQVSEISHELKEMARELKVPVLCLSQLNRAAEQQERPTLSNLRESGSIEQDADMVMFVNRPPNGIVITEYVAEGNKTKSVKRKADWPAELELAANRNGELITIKLDWHPERTQFSAWSDSFYQGD
jgi:replicative DNA helicase